LCLSLQNKIFVIANKKVKPRQKRGFYYSRLKGNDCEIKADVNALIFFMFW
jgi:hypothetical protein